MQTIVFISNYNRLNLLKHAVCSGLRRPLPVNRSTVLDDGSIDSTAEYLENQYAFLEMFRHNNRIELLVPKGTWMGHLRRAVIMARELVLGAQEATRKRNFSLFVWQTRFMIRWGLVVKPRTHKMTPKVAK